MLLKRCFFILNSLLLGILLTVDFCESLEVHNISILSSDTQEHENSKNESQLLNNTALSDMTVDSEDSKDPNVYEDLTYLSSWIEELEASFKFLSSSSRISQLIRSYIIINIDDEEEIEIPEDEVKEKKHGISYHHDLQTYKLLSVKNMEFHRIPSQFASFDSLVAASSNEIESNFCITGVKLSGSIEVELRDLLIVQKFMHELGDKDFYWKIKIPIEILFPLIRIKVNSKVLILSKEKNEPQNQSIWKILYDRLHFGMWFVWISCMQLYNFSISIYTSFIQLLVSVDQWKPQSVELSPSKFSVASIPNDYVATLIEPITKKYTHQYRRKWVNSIKELRKYLKSIENDILEQLDVHENGAIWKLIKDYLESSALENSQGAMNNIGSTVVDLWFT